MLVIHDQKHFDAVVEFARSVSAETAFQNRLDYLANYACEGDPEATRCHLYPDFADHSFVFSMERKTADGYHPWFHGGLIYSGPGQPLDGSFPALTVDLDPNAATGRSHQWSVHT